MDSRRSLKWVPFFFSSRKRSNFLVVADNAAASSLFCGGGEGEDGMSKFGIVGIVNSCNRCRPNVYGDDGVDAGVSAVEGRFKSGAAGPGVGPGAGLATASGLFCDWSSTNGSVKVDCSISSSGRRAAIA